jgi:hypothetical protein
LVVALDGSQPLWLGCWLLAKAKAAKTQPNQRHLEFALGDSSRQSIIAAVGWHPTEKLSKQPASSFAYVMAQ